MHPWTWNWHTHPDVWLMGVVLLGGYHLALRRRARGLTVGRPATRAQVRSYTLGVVVLLVSAEWPIHDLAEGYLYSVHMVQHLLVTLVAPALLLRGTPAWMARALLPGPLMRIARTLTRPIIALAIFNVTIVWTHWPLVVDTTVGSEFAHFGVHALLFLSALIMWMPVLSPTLELPRLSLPAQMIYLFLQSLVPTVPASFLTFSERPLYHVYEHFAKPGGISALNDQRMAGLIMKLVGGAILWVFITAVFFRWHRIEKRDGVDLLEWHEVDQTLNRLELTK